MKTGSHDMGAGGSTGRSLPAYGLACEDSDREGPVSEGGRRWVSPLTERQEGFTVSSTFLSV